MIRTASATAATGYRKNRGGGIVGAVKSDANQSGSGAGG